MAADVSVDLLLTPITSDQFRAKAMVMLQAMGLQPQNWPKGGIASSLLTIFCMLLAMLSTELSGALAQNFNPTASGGGLRMLSKFFYNVTPSTGSFASGSLTITNASGVTITKAVGAVVFASTVANAQGVYPTYTNSVAISLPAGQSTSITITCQFLGSGGNAAPGFVTQVLTSVLGLTCTNPSSISGSDAPTDAELQAQNIASLGARSVYGPRSAFDYAVMTATNVVTGAPVNINKWTEPQATHTNGILMYVTSPTGSVDPNDLAGVALCIENGGGSTDPNFHGARPGTVSIGPGTATIGGNLYGAPGVASIVPYAPTILVTALAQKGTAPSTVQSTILLALTNFFDSNDTNPIGGTLGTDDTNVGVSGIFESGVSGAIATAVASIAGCVMLSTRFQGAADLVLAGNQVASNGISAANLTVSLQYAARTPS